MSVTVRRIDEHSGAGPLGRHVEHDERSRDYPFEAVSAVPLKKVLWTRTGGPFDQGQLGSCTGNAIAGVLNTKPFHKTGKTLTETDAVSIYSAATVVDGVPGTYPPDDTGSSGLAVCKVAQSRGLISGYRHAFSLEQALQALMVGPVITGVSWYESFDTPDSKGLVTIGGSVRGGHEFEVRGYNPKTDLVCAENSWGKGWGVGALGGIFYFTSKTWAALLADQGDVTVPVPL